MAVSASGASNLMLSTENSLKRNSKDVGWEFAVFADPNNLDKLRCKLCMKVVSGGIYRMKQHIANIKGNVAPCAWSSDEAKAKCKAAIDEAKNKKKVKTKHEEEQRDEVQLTLIDEAYEEVEVRGSKKRSRFLGPMDKFVSSINPDSSSMSESLNMRQQNMNDAIGNERRHDVHRCLAQWMYEAGIPFHAIDKDSFIQFVEAVGIFGTGYRPPSHYELKEPLLKEEVERTKGLFKDHGKEWDANGCSVMIDAWTDRKRSIMNLCVNSREGTIFLSSKEDSKEAHTGPYIFQCVDKCIEEVGPQNVIQVVTDNASNNMAAATLLKEKRPNMFWTSCAAHTLNLMLQGIGNLPKFKGVIEKAKACTVFIYAHHKTLALMRKYTKKRDIVRPGVTRFATSFLTLQSLMEKKSELKAMFVSSDWDKCKHSESTKGRMTYSTILNLGFWNGVSLCLKVFTPLINVLRLVNGDKKPSMGFLYGELQQAKEEIKEALKNQETAYRPILEIIDANARDRLDCPLHLAAYLLNPYYFFKDERIQNNSLVIDGVLECVEKFFPDDLDVQSEVMNAELLKYKSKVGSLGKPAAKMGCATNSDKYDPAVWWSNYGNGVPNLQRMATRILSLTTSSSGCERNWSTFERVYTKKMNRLDTRRLNSLVYVQFNAKMINKRKMANKMERDVLLASEASKAQGWIVDGGDEEVEDEGMVGEVESAQEAKRSYRNVEVRELHEEDFISDEEEDEEEDVEFEPETERVLDGYGEEELKA